MPSTLTWLDHDAAERERMNRVLALFKERGTVDELGLGGIRDSIADQLFPGTSTIQTRLRYFLFVPWIYRHLERNGVPSAEIAARGRQLEMRASQNLLSTEELGIFGRHAGGDLKRTPSVVYWGGLGVWGIRTFPGSQDQYHRALDRFYERRRVLSRRDTGDDDQSLRLNTWHPALPAEPDGFPDHLSIQLTREEAEFILDRIKTVCRDSFLRVLADRPGLPDVDFPWELSDYATADQRLLLEHAKLFSFVRQPATILYNLQLAEAGNNKELIDDLRAHVDDWVADVDLQAIAAWDLSEFWSLTLGHGHVITPNAQDFVTRWRQFVLTSPRGFADDEGARELVRRREMLLKGPRSRFTNQRVREERWGGYAGMGWLDYRWFRVTVLLRDLHDGLESR